MTRGKGKSNLTAEKVAEIRELNAKGMNYPTIAKIYNSDSSQIGKICRGQTWKKV